MNCCSRQSGAYEKCFGILSKYYAFRYRRMGPDAMQREMLGQLDRMGLGGKTLLEVGCGVGVLHQTLLERGAASALGVDLAPKMLDHARERARARALDDKVEYRLGDFVEMEAELDPADLTLLDKVVCCYPDAEGMLEAAARHTRVALALVYPRRHWLGTALEPRVEHRLPGVRLGLPKLRARSGRGAPMAGAAWTAARVQPRQPDVAHAGVRR